MYFIGYDIGSSSVKATLLDAQTNRPLITCQYPDEEMEMIAHHPGWAEQDPEIWWEGVVKTTQEIAQNKNVDLKDVEAIGISYQMHGLVLIDKEMEVLRPAIIWCDSRAVEIGQKAFEEIGKEICLSHLLNSPGNFTAAKLAWVSQYEPDTYKKIYKMMLPGDYIAMKMSGRPQSTYSGLSEGILYDFKNQKISAHVMDYFGFDLSLIPEIVPTFSIQAELKKSSAKLLGLQPGTKICYRAGDQPNNALSLNVMHPGEIQHPGSTHSCMLIILTMLQE